MNEPSRPHRSLSRSEAFEVLVGAGGMIACIATWWGATAAIFAASALLFLGPLWGRRVS